MARKSNFRNIAIIAHVDHGKTTLVDFMLRQSGIFRDNQELKERIMDSGDLERERGITITAKNTSVMYKGVKINIIDTPGHADFGGEVERGLNMVDGVILLVDASEGPLPQTRFVLRKALEKKLAVVLVINKIDRSDARAPEVLDEVYNLFIDLDADETQIEFPVIYAIGKFGLAFNKIGDESTSLIPLFEAIINTVPGPEVDENQTTQFLVTNIEYDSYVGQIGLGPLVNGTLEMNKEYAISTTEGLKNGVKFSALYTFDNMQRKPVNVVEAGDIIAVAGIPGIKIGDSITSVENPQPLPRIKVDEPTVSMIFYVNNSPFSGREGKFLTTRNLKDRLEREVLGNVAIRVKPTERVDAFEVCGRGELQMAVLIETMRREGFELAVSKPNVITREINGQTMEPVEHLYLDIPEEFVGVLTERLAQRKGRMTHLMNKGSGRVNLEFDIPTRGLIGFRNQFLTDTKGSGIMNALFKDWEPWFGAISHRSRGALIADRNGKVTAYACLAMEDRGQRTVEVGTEVYSGMVVGERNKADDIDINITREKKLTNMRASSSDATVVLRPPRVMSLDQAIEFITDNELVEVTPQSIRIRKIELDNNRREKSRKTRLGKDSDDQNDD